MSSRLVLLRPGQFLGQLQKPDVDYLAGLSPAISIQQKAAWP